MNLENIIAVQADSNVYEQVLKLWRADSATLGPMPEGGFRDHALRGWLLALCEKEAVAGYVMFRRSRERAAIVHLCVSPLCRGKGIAKILINAVSERTQDCAGIGLKCRRDYAANKIWPSLGFASFDEVTGRSKSGATLTCWWRDHGHQNLLSVPKTTFAQRVVIDMNIFVHWRDQSNEEAQALQADWLEGLIDFCLTDEIYNEIDRHPDNDARKSSRAFAQSIQCPAPRPTAVESCSAKLRQILRPDGSESDQSDFRQIAKTIAVGISVFVTQDERLLNHADSIYEEFSVRVVRPGELITELDAIRREEEYRPARLAGTQLTIRRDRLPELPSVVDAFQSVESSESKTELSRHISAMLAQPDDFEILVARSTESSLLGCIAFRRTSSDEMTVPLLRVSRTPQAPTLVRHLLYEAIKRTVAAGCALTRITDRRLQKVTHDAVWRDYWRTESGEWIKASPVGLGTAEILRDQLKALASRQSRPEKEINPLMEMLVDRAYLADPFSCLKLERMYWPYKVLDANLPCYVMPIRPGWAQHLFDSELAANDLLGADEAVALNREFVYYRSSKQKLPKAPGRVLWYVSKAIGEIRATSLITDVIIGPAKELFTRNRRYGVYHWKNISDLVKGKVDKDIMVVTLSNTETFKVPISYQKAITTLAKHCVKTTFVSPVSISTNAYFELCDAGRRGHHA